MICLNDAGNVAALHGSRAHQVTDAHQDTTDRKRGNRQHQGFAQLLQLLHHKKHSS